MFRRWERRDAERGATLVEYALAVALIAFVASVGVQGLQAAFGSDLNVVKRQISVGDRNIDIGDNTTTSSTTTTTTTTTPPTTTTTTTAPTTTTTTSTSTTTTTTTTAPAGIVGRGSFGAVTTSTNGTVWTGRTTLTMRTTGGQAIAGAAVTVTVRYPLYYGFYYQEYDLTGTTNASGQVTFTSNSLNEGQTIYSSATVAFTLTGATIPGGTWDGYQATVTGNQP